MESKTVGLLRKFESIKAHAQEVYGSFKQLENKNIEVKSTIPENIEVPIEIAFQQASNIKETRMILDSYSNSSSDIYNITKMSLPYIPGPSKTEEAKGALQRLIIECDNVIGILGALITPLSPEDADRLNKLRSELTDVTRKLDINYEKNLHEAINEQEKGHNLASALITARVMSYILDQIEGKDSEEKIKFLQDKNIVEKGKEGEEAKAFIIKASKKARNIFSHDIKIFANPSDSLGLLGDCIRLVRILEQLKN